MARQWRLEVVDCTEAGVVAFGRHNLDIDRAYPWRFISSYMRTARIGSKPKSTTRLYGAFLDSLFDQKEGDDVGRGCCTTTDTMVADVGSWKVASTSTCV